MFRNILITILLLISTFLFAGTPDWEVNENDYETNSGVTAIVYIDDDVQGGADDILAAFGPDGSVRGVASPAGNIPVPPSPYFGLNHYNIQVFGNLSEADNTFTFKYYSASNDQVVELTETLTFAPPAAVGDVMEPLILNGTLSTDPVDCAGVPGGDAVEDECGVCGGDGPAENFTCDVFQPQTTVALQTAVDLWVSDNSSALSTYGDINTWDVFFITDMSELFQNKTDFNDDISSWDVSSVINMYLMFNNAQNFNQDIGSWNVSSVEDMQGMFQRTYSFNQDISGWNTSSVTTMKWMFLEASSFNQDISSWDVSKVMEMTYMFRYATSFNQDLSNWNVSRVNTMYGMFLFTSNFNGDISDWDVSSVTRMNGMFRESNFNGDISDWDVSKVTEMSRMFENNTNFNQYISHWDVDSVTHMIKMFNGASSFNQDISDWDVSNVTFFNYAGGMFEGAISFNQDISDWNFSNVTDMRSMFKGASSFNQDLSSWDVSSAERMDGIFNGATSFNQDLSSWDVSRVTDMTDMFNSTDALSSANKCAMDAVFTSNGNWPYDWTGFCVRGCTDPYACNYDETATEEDGSCEFYDCAGDCGGSAEVDECDVCGGDGPAAGFDCAGNQVTYIPDDNFEQALINLGYDDVLDNYVITDNINDITDLQLPGENISKFSDVTGINNFVSLGYLNFNSHLLTSIDVSGLPDLYKIQIAYQGGDGITELDLSNNTGLVHLEAAGNTLTSIDLSNNTLLYRVDLRYSPLTTIDLSNSPNLNYLGVGNSQLTRLDFSNNTGFKSLSAENSQLTSLNLINVYSMTGLNIKNNSLTCVEVSNPEYYIEMTDSLNNDPHKSWFVDEGVVFKESCCGYAGYNEDTCTLIPGCTDSVACNYNDASNTDDGSCEYSPSENHDCAGNCTTEIDCAGICGGSTYDQGCGCGIYDKLPTDGCDDVCGSTAVEDCAGVCGGSTHDQGCGCGVAGPSGCDNACGSELENDECGECGGDGIDEGACDCAGNVEDCAGECGGSAEVDDCGVCNGGNADDLGCGCFEPGPSGCDNACGSNAELDECGECGGDGIDEGACNCAGDVEDDCGVCAGDSSSCEAYVESSVTTTVEDLASIDTVWKENFADLIETALDLPDNTVEVTKVNEILPRGSIQIEVEFTITLTEEELNQTDFGSTVDIEEALADVEEEIEDSGIEFTYGCTDENACNYDVTATIDDGSCTYIPSDIFDGPSDWEVNENDYETNSGVTAIVYIDDYVQGGADDILAAFGPDGSVRGVASPAGNIPVPLSPYFGLNHYQITVYGNLSEAGITFTLKYYSASNDAVFDIAETIVFAPPSAIGDAMNPVILHGDGIDESVCDCDGNVEDCAGECGGSAEVDECGECGGDGSSCGPPAKFEFEQSTQQALYSFVSVTIEGDSLDADDWVGAFNIYDETKNGLCSTISENCPDLNKDGNLSTEAEICVGARKWDTSECDGDCAVPVMGDDLTGLTEGYMTTGDIPTFIIYDSSEGHYYNATSLENISPWSNGGAPTIESLENADLSCPVGTIGLAYYLNDTDICVPEELATLVASQLVAGYFFKSVTIDDVSVNVDDWVGAFKGDTCVGARKWDISLCNGGVCEIPVYGEKSNEAWTEGYMTNGDIPSFKIFDASNGFYFNAVASEDHAWADQEFLVIDSLNVFFDCSGVLGGSAIVDECGVCDADYETIPEFPYGNCDCAEIPNGDNVENNCGTCLPQSEVDDDGSSTDCTQDCAGTWGGDLVDDECGICGGSGPPEHYNCEGQCTAGVDCNGLCGGDAEVDACGVCDGVIIEQSDCGVGCNAEGDHLNDFGLDCSGECGGTAVEDSCGVCNGTGPTDYYNCDGDCTVDIDCYGVCGGAAYVDECDICSGGNSGHEADSDQDCNDECWGDAYVDECDICSGGDSGHAADSDIDCNGVCFGSAVTEIFYYDYDNDGLGSDTSQEFCNANLPQSWVSNSDDQCPDFDDNADLDLDGIADGCDDCPQDAENDSDGDDVCGNIDICPGYNDNADSDSDGIADGCDLYPLCFSNIIDDCGVCDGGNAYQDCNEECPPDTPNGCDEEENPACGTAITEFFYLDSDNDGLGSDTSQEFCNANVPQSWVSNSDDLDDNCPCEENNDNCHDCMGVCGGALEVDECGECGGSGIADGKCDCAGNVEDCIGVCGGDAYYDPNCGDGTLCVGGETESSACIADCMGEWGGDADVDACGVCDAAYETQPEFPYGNCDCGGVPNGEAKEDNCGDCNCGDNDTHESTCISQGDCVKDCYGEWGGIAQLDECGVCDAAYPETGKPVPPYGDCDCNGDVIEEDDYECDSDINDFTEGCAIIDNCNVCVGGSTGLTACQEDCAGDPGGTSDLDECGICVEGGQDGGNSTCEKDCADVWGGSNYEDNCKICDSNPENDCLCTADAYENGYCVEDCMGVLGGSAEYDECGICKGDNSSCIDVCGVPWGDSSTCEDCNGDPNGEAKLDDCGICSAGNSGHEADSDLDECSICFGDNSSCADCIGVPNGPADEEMFYLDIDIDGFGSGEGYLLCNGLDLTGWVTNNIDNDDNCQCEGNDDNCHDCMGVCGGAVELDECGECGGSGIADGKCDCAGNVEDCTGVCGGDAYYDPNCGDGTLCVGGETEGSACIADCMGEWGGDAEVDACGVCDAAYETQPEFPYGNCDCGGVPNGDAKEDNCGDCNCGENGNYENVEGYNGDPSTCISQGDCVKDCYGEWGGIAQLDECGVCDAAYPETGKPVPPYGDCDCNGDVIEADDYECNSDINDITEGCAIIDNCNDCVGGSTGLTACEKDCNGVSGGTSDLDECGICVEGGQDGGNSTCEKDCADVWGGSNYEDNCKICDSNPDNDCACTADGYENGDCVKDCMGIWNGSAKYDECISNENPNGICGGDNSACADCFGIHNGNNILSDCGCIGPEAGHEGDKDWCDDCFGTPFGVAELDYCEICYGGNSGNDDPCKTDCSISVQDCAGNWLVNGDCEEDGLCCWGGSSGLDECGICVEGGQTVGNSTCVQDCGGQWGGSAVHENFYFDSDGDGLGSGDKSGFCSAFIPSGWVHCDNVDDANDNCLDDLEPDCFSNDTDDCDVCGGDNSTCADCGGIPYGDAEVDMCGDCICRDNDTDESTCISQADCEQDCAGVWGGNAKEDFCGTCHANGESSVTWNQSCNQPIANDMFVQILEDDSLHFELSVTGPDNVALQIIVLNSPDSITTSISGTTATFVPDSNYFNSDPVSFTFIVIGGTCVDDQSAATLGYDDDLLINATACQNEYWTSSPATIEIYVDAVNDAPTLLYCEINNIDECDSTNFNHIPINAYLDPEGEPTVDFSQYVMDVDGDQLTITSLPYTEETDTLETLYGILAKLDDESLKYKYIPGLNAMAEGLDYILFKANDEDTQTSLGILTIINDNTIPRGRGKPKAFGDIVYVNEDNEIEISLVGFDPFVPFNNPNSSLFDNSDPTLGTLTTLEYQVGGSDRLVEWKATYTPDLDESGTDQISFIIYNESNTDISESDEALIEINITEVNDLPVIDLISDVEMLEDDEDQITITYSDIETTNSFDVNINVVGVDNDTVLVKSQSGTDGTTTLEIDPTENEFGLYQVDVEVLDSGVPPGRATATFMVDVASVNDPPDILSAPSSAEIELGTVYSFQVIDEDVDDIILTYSLSNQAPPGMTISGSGLILWAPDSMHVDGGPYENIQVTVSDGNNDNGDTPSDPFSLEAYFVDCGGIKNGDAQEDMCGDCNCGDNDTDNGESTCIQQEDCEPDCADVWGGTKDLDDCGICLEPTHAFWNQACADCGGIPDGDAQEDMCGDCNCGDNDTDNGESTCIPQEDCEQDCTDIWGGTKDLDDCGICMEPTHAFWNQACADCGGIPDGDAQVDMCGDCNCGENGNYENVEGYNGDPSTCEIQYDCVLDCAGQWGGTAELDNCGICSGGTTGIDVCKSDCSDLEALCGGVWIDDGDCTDGGCCWGGSLELDLCGKCGGDNTTCVDCLGIVAGPNLLDECDICNGDNSSCDDCWDPDGNGIGEIDGEAYIDNCDNCVGGNTNAEACTQDCAGIWGGPLLNDECGICNGDGLSCLDDCGVPYLLMQDDPEWNTTCLDDCGVPYLLMQDDPEWNTTCADCAGVPNGADGIPNNGDEAVEDNCGICDSNSANDCVKDCAGVWGGDAELANYYQDTDSDGFGAGNVFSLCNSNVPSGMVDNNADSDDNCTTNIHDCLGECNGDLLGTGVFECEDPDFDNEEDCPEGQWNQFGADECGVCGGNNSCLDCGEYPNGDAELDMCNECLCGADGNYGEESTCTGDYDADQCILDCAGQWGGDAVEDNCSICSGGTSGNDPCEQDCAGDWGGSLEFDQCISVENPNGICGGNNSTCVDCLGVFGGDTEFDTCGICNGDNSSCADCAGVPNGNYEVDECDQCVDGGQDGGNSNCVLGCDGLYNIDAIVFDDCNICGGDGLSCLDDCGVPYLLMQDDPLWNSTCSDDCGVSYLLMQDDPAWNTIFSDGSSCLDCAGLPNGSYKWDECQVCDNNSANDCVQDCAGVWGGVADSTNYYYDTDSDGLGAGNAIYICDDDASNDMVENNDDINDNCTSNILDCSQDCNGTAWESDCGCVAYEDGTSEGDFCDDCAGIPNGSNVVDYCGTCNAESSNDCAMDCAGIWGGSNYEDNCDICDTDSTNDCVKDCAGEWGGYLVDDECGECDGDNSSCEAYIESSVTTTVEDLESIDAVWKENFEALIETALDLPDNTVEVTDINTILSRGNIQIEVEFTITLTQEELDETDFGSTDDIEEALVDVEAEIEAAEDGIEFISGCVDENACNYDETATIDDGSCTYISDGACDCDGNVEDECGECGGDGIADGKCDCAGNVEDECGECGGDGIADGKCDCAGNVLDECEVCGGDGIDEGACDCDGHVEDCTGLCNGDAVVDECDICAGGTTDLEISYSDTTITDQDTVIAFLGSYDCSGVCFGDAIVDEECGECGIPGTTCLSLYFGLIPDEFKIHNIYPNPFNPSVNIVYTLPEYSHVKVTVYDVRGRVMEVLTNGFETMGYYTIKWDASAFSSGVYFVEMHSESFRQVRKVLHMK